MREENHLFGLRYCLLQVQTARLITCAVTTLEIIGQANISDIKIKIKKYVATENEFNVTS